MNKASVYTLCTIALLSVQSVSFPQELLSQRTEKYIGGTREDVYKAQKELEEREAKHRAELEHKRKLEREKREHEIKLAAMQAEKEQQDTLQTLLWALGIAGLGSVVALTIFKRKRISPEE